MPRQGGHGAEEEEPSCGGVWEEQRSSSGSGSYRGSG